MDMEDTYGNMITSLAQSNDHKIVMLVLDGLGDCDNDGKGTALQIARTPNMDSLAQESALGLFHPVSPGITPGSGPGHLGLFGYDPVLYQIGRGVLSALGIGYPLEQGDVAARMNFCRLDERGMVADRRAGRISTERNKELIAVIREKVKTGDAEVVFETVAEHRGLLVLKGDNLDDRVGDTDPQETGIEPLDPARPPYDSSRTARIIKGLTTHIGEVLKDEPDANMLIIRGVAQLPDWPSFHERYGLNPTAVAGYPMYRGIARLLGMDVWSEPTDPVAIIGDTLKAMEEHDFVFSHFKDTDKTGEDGDIRKKAEAIEKMDAALPELLRKAPDVLIITGDHSTPAPLSSHSWHPVPLLLNAPYTRGPYQETFDEISAARGELGIFLAREIMPLAMAHAEKLKKFGA
ncbi:MAG: 2,3-bisphosphoglycerate-independent phosphoglycerate mutase [Bacteroidales bacterium]